MLAIRRIVCGLIPLLFVLGCGQQLPDSSHQQETSSAALAEGFERTAVLINASAPAHDVFGAHFCGGALVGKRAVITAAHCIQNRAARTIDVIIGADNLCRTERIAGERIRVGRIVEVPDGRDQSDLAVLLLSSPSTRNSLPIFGVDSVAELSAVGWGRTSVVGPHRCHRRSIDLELASGDDCSQARAIGITFASSDQICAVAKSDERQNTCIGDSGGPVFGQRNGRVGLVAVTSWGVGCDVDDVGFYTALSPHENWLLKLDR